MAGFQICSRPEIVITFDPEAIAFFRERHARAVAYEGSKERAHALEAMFAELVPWQVENVETTEEGDAILAKLGLRQSEATSHESKASTSNGRALWYEVVARLHAVGRAAEIGSQGFADPIRHDLLLEALARLTQGRFQPEAIAQHFAGTTAGVSFIRPGVVYRFEADPWEQNPSNVLGAINRCLRDEHVHERFLAFPNGIVFFVDPARWATATASLQWGSTLIESEEAEPRPPFGILITGRLPHVMSIRRSDHPVEPTDAPAPPRRIHPELWLRHNVFALDPENVVETSKHGSIGGPRGDIHVSVDSRRGCAFQAVHARAAELAGNYGALELPGGARSVIDIEPVDAPHLHRAFLLRSRHDGYPLIHEELFGCLESGAVLHVNARAVDPLSGTTNSLVREVGLAARSSRPSETPPGSAVWLDLGDVWVPLPADCRAPHQMNVVFRWGEESAVIELEAREDSRTSIEEVPRHYEIDNFLEIACTGDGPFADQAYEVDPIEEFATSWGTGRLYVHRLLDGVRSWDPQRIYTVVILAEINNGCGLHVSFMVVEQLPPDTFSVDAQRLIDRVRDAARSSRFRGR